MAARILVVDDERGIADSLHAILEYSGYESKAVYNASEALEVLRTFRPHLVLTDVVMPGMSGVEFASELRQMYPDVFVILLSGNAGTEELLTQAGDSLEPTLILAKPYSPRELLRVIRELTSAAAD